MFHIEILVKHIMPKQSLNTFFKLTENPHLGIGLYYDEYLEHEIKYGDIVHIVKNKFSDGGDEIWTIDYEAPSFVVYNQINSNREIKETTWGPHRHCFSPDGQNELFLEYLGNKYDNANLLKL